MWGNTETFKELKAFNKPRIPFTTDAATGLTGKKKIKGYLWWKDSKEAFNKNQILLRNKHRLQIHRKINKLDAKIKVIFLDF